MATPYRCECGVIIGYQADPVLTECLSGRAAFNRIEQLKNFRCPGVGKHPKPIRQLRFRLFGLIQEVKDLYSETNTSTTWKEYIGSPSPFMLRLAIIFGTKRHVDGGYEGLKVNGKWVWLDPKKGLCGEGVGELFKK